MTNEIETFKGLIGRVAERQELSVEDARTAFDIMMSGDATPSQMGAFLMALRVRGETVDELTGGAMAMRAKAQGITAPANAIDTCGTGGDAKGTWNVSTAVSFVLAAHDIPVAKHGNRALSSKTGAADVLTALGVNIECPFPLVEKSLRDACIGFLMAPRHHGAMRHVGPTRVELGTRTIFNLLGPLSNPAGAKRQIMGVFAKQWVEPLAHVQNQLGADRVWVMHGADGMDELTTTGVTHVAELANGQVRTFDVTPEDAGLAVASPDDLKGGEPAENAAALRGVLQGQKNAFRDIVLLNAAAGLIVAEKTETLREGAAMAAEVLDNGRALARLEQLVAISNETGGA
ncbi:MULTISPECIES: anthranilate phosphoribosyltransferase [unclassified Minwuia]|uniref:anthranilate phosphoribosyltransferase n=1 Tax=unclassified Minwuia TaxID=2618799 RepID=UPI00247AECE6|nr:MULTISPECIES: anthranilate phosphoribosyltransferase [unclassified Minwuia]